MCDMRDNDEAVWDKPITHRLAYKQNDSSQDEFQ